MTLYTKIRPKTFDEVKGQEFTVNNLRMQSIRDKFFQVIVLAGQYGAGKTTLARIVAAAAPPVPSLRMPIKRKSRAMFTVMAAARKDRATLVLPIDRRIPDKRL